MTDYIDGRLQDIELKGQEIIYTISKHFQISPVEVENMDAGQISRWYTWAGVMEEKKREQTQRSKKTSESTVSLPYDKVTEVW